MVYNSNDHYRRLVAESSLFKRVPNFNSMQSTLLFDDGTSELILKSEPRFLRHVGWMRLLIICFACLFRSFQCFNI